MLRTYSASCFTDPNDQHQRAKMCIASLGSQRFPGFLLCASLGHYCLSQDSPATIGTQVPIGGAPHHQLCNVQAAPANEEVLEMLAEFLPRRFPDRFSCSGSLIHNHATNQTLDLAEPGRNPLEIASLLVQVSSLIVACQISSNAASDQILSLVRMGAVSICVSTQMC